MVLLGSINGCSGLPRYFISIQDVAGYIMVAVFCSLLNEYRGLLGGLVVLLGFISVQDFASCIMVAEFCSV